VSLASPRAASSNHLRGLQSLDSSRRAACARVPLRARGFHVRAVHTFATLGVVLSVVAFGAGCGSSKRSSASSTAAPVASGTTAPSTTNSQTPAGPTPSPSPASPAPTPTPPASGSGSGGSGGGVGDQTRTVTTQAQAGLPAVTVQYDLYVPSTYDPATPTPWLFAANMGLTPYRALAEAEGFIVVDFRDHDRDGGFRYDYDVLLLNATLADVQGAWNVDLDRLYYHGFSAGAHWGYTVVLANGNTFAGLGINAGSLTSAIQQGIWPNQVQRKVAVAIRHGTSDQVVPVAAAQQDRARLTNAQHPVQYEEFAGGHTVSAQDAQSVWSYLKQFNLP